jgi:thiamine-monophosphate kinase
MGEFDLIERLRERFGLEIGDDAAITVPGGATATSVDALVDGVHFRRKWTPLRAIGHKALAASLSDLAAMAAEPGEAYVVLGVPEDLSEPDCLEIYEGIDALARETQTQLAGGDVSRAPALTLSVTVVGHAADPASFVRRSGAGPGDALALTGELGGAAAGLLLLERPDLAASVGKDVAARLRARQLEPAPRLAAARALAAAGATAMIDVSDGLAADAAHLAAASGVGLEIDVEKAPIQPGVAELAEAAGVAVTDLTLGGGEDYELLVAVPTEALGPAAAAVRAAGAELTTIGAVIEGAGIRLEGPDGSIEPPPGYDQLRTPASP